MQKTKDETDKNVYLYTYMRGHFVLPTWWDSRGKKNQDATISLLVCSLRRTYTQKKSAQSVLLIFL